MSLQVIKFEVDPVFTKKDPDCLARLFGDLPRDISLDISRFPDYDEWPEYDPAQKLGIAWFAKEVFPNFSAVDERLTERGFGPERRTFPFHLAIEIIPRIVPWHKRGIVPIRIYSSSIQSYWRNDEGELYLLGIDVCTSCGLMTHDIQASFNSLSGFLVSCE